MFPIYFFIVSSVCAMSSENRKFAVDFQWRQLNFTWSTSEDYKHAIITKNYIPGNSALAGIKIYKDRLYLAMPRVRLGTPVTLGYINLKTNVKMDHLIAPFPNWASNELGDCTNLQSVQSMEIDKNGIMWVIDGFRINNMTKCPAKLVLIDLNSKEEGEIVHTFSFPEQICLSEGGFLNDIVIDCIGEDNFAYITDNGGIDPGLIVYSRKENKSWKLRDSSMFPEISAVNFTVDGIKFDKLAPIDGIALSPPNKDGKKSLYYCSLTGYNLHSISTDILKDETTCLSGEWRSHVKFIGKKQAQSDGLVIDNKGDLYYGLLPLYAVGKWNIYQPFSTSEIVDHDQNTMIWTDSFAFDEQGYLYLLCNNIHKFFNPDYKFSENDVKIRILKLFTDTKSYLHR